MKPFVVNDCWWMVKYCIAVSACAYGIGFLFTWSMPKFGFTSLNFLFAMQWFSMGDFLKGIGKGMLLGAMPFMKKAVDAEWLHFRLIT